MSRHPTANRPAKNDIFRVRMEMSQF